MGLGAWTDDHLDVEASRRDHIVNEVGLLDDATPHVSANDFQTARLGIGTGRV